MTLPPTALAAPGANAVFPGAAGRAGNDYSGLSPAATPARGTQTGRVNAIPAG